jgi:hypothetical protein
VVGCKRHARHIFLQQKCAPQESPGNTPWEKLDSAVRTVFSVPKEALQKEQARLKEAKEQKKRKKKPS